MLFHYLKVLLRTLWRNKTYTSLNILGLTGGMIAFLLIALYVQYEFSFDQYHTQKDRIYRVVKQQVGNEYMGTDHFAVTPAPLASTLQEEYPEVLAATHLFVRKNNLIGVGDQTYLENKVFGASQEIFDIFSIDIVSGNQAELLTRKYSGVISRSLAQKYFGDVSPIGQTIRYKDAHPFTVMGVMEDMPANGHFQIDLILDFEAMMDSEIPNMKSWRNSSFYTYCLLQEGTNPADLEAKFPALVAKYFNENYAGIDEPSRLYLQALPTIHLHSAINFEINPNGDIRTLRMLTLIAILILLIAGINYINLSTAKAFRRAREIGIRKTVGAQRGQLIIQFLGESFFLTGCSLLLALTVVHYLLPGFSNFVDRELSLSPFEQLWLTPFLLLTFLLVGLLSGTYPALILSAFQPLTTLKNNISSGQKKSFLRNTLVVTQFSVSAALIISTLVIARQLNFIQTKDLGFNREQVIVLNIRDFDLRKKTPILKEELLKIPEVKMVSAATSMPNFFDSTTGADWPGRPEDVDIRLYTGLADYDYLDLFEMELVEGRGFSRAYGDESNSVLLNESALKALGWEEEPLGRQMITWGGDTASVVGVLKDFHHNSLHLSITPMQLFFEEASRQIAVKVSGRNLPETIAAIEAAQQQFSPNYPVEYQFFEETFEATYRNEVRVGKMARWFTLLIIVIACLGLYGLSAFTLETRTKEVGIRKILGASVSSLLLLLSRNFLLLILLAFLIAAPVAYYLMAQWLQNFAYHIDIGFTVFIWTLAAMIAITLLTVGYKTLKAATNKPVEALQQE